MRPYDPKGFSGFEEFDCLQDIPKGQAGILRRWRIAERRKTSIAFDLPERLSIPFPPSNRVVLDDRTSRGTVTLLEYLKALESGSLVDVAVRRESNDEIQGIAFWCHVEYRGEHFRKGYVGSRPASLKPDALFAYRLAYAGKTERHAAKWLESLGHDLRGPALEVGDSIPVVIDYRKGRDRAERPDLHCRRCQVVFEVKGRMNDHHRRFSHSQNRPFWEENPIDGYNLLVFPDGSIEAYGNADLEQVIRDLAVKSSEPYNAYVQLPHAYVEKLSLPQNELRCVPKET